MQLKKSKRQINHLVVHCTATKENYPFTAKDIDQWHKTKGWKGIGYNYVIDLDGTIEIGRDVDLIPAQVEGWNAHAIGLVYVGGLDKNTLKPKDTRTLQQKESMRNLLSALKSLYPNAKILGHRDFPNVKKACPCFDVQNDLYCTI